MEQGVRELEAFAAVVYSSDFDMQVPGFGPDLPGPATGTSATKTGATSSVSPNPSSPEIVTDLNVRSLDEAEEDTGVAGISLRDEENEKEEKESEPSEGTPAATGADSGFEEVWGKASASIDASSTPGEI